jgi:ABC-type multidrug transport system fused ATPase/permease subunit
MQELRFAPRRHASLFRGGARAVAATAAAAAPPARRRPAAAVHLLTFDGLVCTVPVRRGRPWYSRLRRWLCCGARSGGGAGDDAEVAAPGLASSPALADPPGRKAILRGVSGVAACGELVGVLGPSGSGKTTLLAALAGSSEDLDARAALAGTVLLDGRQLDAAARRRVGYVAQDDTLLPTLTVEECVRYSAILR